MSEFKKGDYVNVVDSQDFDSRITYQIENIYTCLENDEECCILLDIENNIKWAAVSCSNLNLISEKNASFMYDSDDDETTQPIINPNTTNNEKQLDLIDIESILNDFYDKEIEASWGEPQKPKNNDGRDTCFKCGTKTIVYVGLNSLGNICPKCKI